jgi:asparagine synthase (glutamine-hydrolysing)
VAAYRDQLETAIKCRLESDYAIGSELSGGIDSSTITAFAARLLDQPLSRLHAFGFAFSELEPQYILAVSQACRLPNTHIVAARQTDQQATTLRSLKLLGYPMEHGNGPFHEPFYQLAEKLEVRTLLSGFGGDEFGTTIHGYMVPMEMLLQGRYWELFGNLAGNPLFRLLRLLKLEWRRRKTANFTATSYDPGFFESYRQRWAHHIVRPDLVHRYGLEESYFNEARFDAGYTDLKRFTIEKRWMPFVPTRMENCTLMAAGRKIDYRWPLLDVRLVRLFLSIPAVENFHRGMGRYLHRRAIDGVVPKLVAWKPGKHMGAIPGGQDARDTDHLRQFTLDALHPALAMHLDTDKLQQQVEQLPAILAAPLGDNKKFQNTRNIRAVISLGEWLDYMESMGDR